MPVSTSIGTASPVSDAWLISELPETMVPSTGKFSPGRIRTIMPIAISLSATICSFEPSINRALPGVRSTRSLIARCAPQAVRLKMRFAIQRKSAKKPAAKYMSAERAATTASEARESLAGFPFLISSHAPLRRGMTKMIAPIAAGIWAIRVWDPRR